jgi:hypothetical protein
MPSVDLLTIEVPPVHDKSILVVEIGIATKLSGIQYEPPDPLLTDATPTPVFVDITNILVMH